MVCVSVCVCENQEDVKPNNLSGAQARIQAWDDLLYILFSHPGIGHAGSVSRTGGKQISILFTYVYKVLGYSFKDRKNQSKRP